MHKQDLLETWQYKSDPFNIFETWQQVGLAWLHHFDHTLSASSRLLNDFYVLQTHHWQRMFGLQRGDAVPAIAEDDRFKDPAWTESPYFDQIKQNYLLVTRWLMNEVEHTPGLDETTRQRAVFWARQLVDFLSPTNFFWTNPIVLKRTMETQGKNLVDGWKNFLDDLQHGDLGRMVSRESFTVGKDLAVTPGSVVFRNDLFELIQYHPTTEKVQSTPIVFIPPWINKFYILDLNPKKSMVKYLLDQGFTVFMVSWKNVTGAQRNINFENYMFDGVLSAINVAREITGSEKAHPVGYCIGGTTLSALMAWLSREYAEKPAQMPVSGWTLFTTLTDFREPGDIQVFISENSIRTIEDLMAEKGYLDGKEMGLTFRLLRPNSLFWNYLVADYLLGQTPPALDVLFWNIDTTRMPEAMHRFYLREFYLNNRLCQANSLTLGKQPINLGDIHEPVYMVGTEEDHIAPWKQTFRLASLVQGSVRYALSTSGHILGVVNPVVNPPKRKYRVGEAQGYHNPQTWADGLSYQAGSWWEDWRVWLQQRTGTLVTPPPIGGTKYPVLCAAPGAYVLEH